VQDRINRLIGMPADNQGDSDDEEELKDEGALPQFIA
jgi:hypothetical protein